MVEVLFFFWEYCCGEVLGVLKDVVDVDVVVVILFCFEFIYGFLLEVFKVRVFLFLKWLVVMIEYVLIMMRVI